MPLEGAIAAQAAICRSEAPVLDAAGKLAGIDLAGTTEEVSSDVQGMADGLDVVRKALVALQPG